MMQQQYQISADEINALGNDTFSKYVLESQQTIERITHFLKGEIMVTETIVQNGQQVMIPQWKQLYKPVMNEEGVNYVVQMLTLILDKTIAASNLDDYQADRMANNTMNALAYVFYSSLHNGNSFAFGSFMEMSSMLDYMNNIILSQLKRAVGMGTLKQLQTNHSVVEQRSYSNEPRGKEYYEMPTMGV